MEHVDVYEVLRSSDSEAQDLYAESIKRFKFLAEPLLF